MIYVSTYTKMLWQMVLCFLVMLVLPRPVRGSGDQCRGWADSTFFDGFCYKLITETTMTWDQAELLCEQEIDGGHLAEGTTENRLTFLREMAMLNNTRYGVWLGGRRNLTTGEIQWVTAMTDVVTNAWGYTQPHLLGECLGLNARPGWRLLHAASCQLTQHNTPMCQRSVPDPCEELPEGGEFFDRYCFTYHAGTVDFQSAQKKCENLHRTSKIATPSTDALFGFMQRFLNRNVHTRIVVADESEVDLEESLGLTFESASELSFSVKACQDAYVKLFDKDDPHLYYRIMLGGHDNSIAKLEYGYGLMVAVVDTVARNNILSCEEATVFHLRWSNSEYIQVEPLGLHGNTTNVQIKNVVLSMGKYTGEWVLGSPNTWSFLGASDAEEEGKFVWLSSEKEVDSDKWQDGAPEGGREENYLAMAGLLGQFVDVAGDNTTDWIICQRNILSRARYVIVPEISPSAISSEDGGVSVGTNQNVRRAHVTSAQSGFVNVAWGLNSEDGTIDLMDSFSGRERALQIDVPQNVLLGPPGVYDLYVKIEADHEIEVVFTEESPSARYSYLVPPSRSLRLHTDYFVLTSGGVLHGTDQITITSLGMNNNISIVLSEAHVDSLQLTHHGVTYSYPVSGQVTLDSWETVVLQSTSDLTGTMVSGGFGLMVLAGTMDAELSVTQKDSALEAALPIGYLGTEYFTFPCLPLEETETDTFLLLGVYDETSISIEQPGAHDVWLQSAGDHTTITLPRDGFYRVSSDLPFYVNKVGAVRTSGACLSSLIPPNLWRNEYAFKIMYSWESVVFIIQADDITESRISLDNTALTEARIACRNISGTTRVGCILSFQAPGQHILSHSTSTFPAYLYADTGTSVNCHSLGMDFNPPAYSFEDFDPAHYLEIHRCFPSSGSNDTAAETTNATTTTTTTTTNITRSQIDEQTRKIQEELTVPSRNTSSFRRSKTSARDDRASSAAIGVTGVLVVASTFAFLSLSDVINFVRPEVTQAATVANRKKPSL